MARRRHHSDIGKLQPAQRLGRFQATHFSQSASSLNSSAKTRGVWRQRHPGAGGAVPQPPLASKLKRFQIFSAWHLPSKAHPPELVADATPSRRWGRCVAAATVNTLSSFQAVKTLEGDLAAENLTRQNSWPGGDAIHALGMLCRSHQVCDRNASTGRSPRSSSSMGFRASTSKSAYTPPAVAQLGSSKQAPGGRPTAARPLVPAPPRPDPLPGTRPCSADSVVGFCTQGGSRNRSSPSSGTAPSL